jgi:hypothetical protein
MQGGLAVTAAPSLINTARAQTGKPMLVFLGNAEDEAHKRWRRQSEQPFQKSDAFQKLDYRVVFPKSGDLMLKEESWPADARWVLAEFLNTREGKGLATDQPHFILAQDKKIILVAVGNGGWPIKMLPKIAEVTGAKAS